MHWIIGCKIHLVGRAWLPTVPGTYRRRSRKTRRGLCRGATTWQCRYRSMIYKRNESINSHSGWATKTSVQLLRERMRQRQWALRRTGAGWELVTYLLLLQKRIWLSRAYATTFHPRSQLQTKSVPHRSRSTVPIQASTSKDTTRPTREGNQISLTRLGQPSSRNSTIRTQRT